MENDLISSNKSGNKPEGSRIDQLLCRAQVICKSLLLIVVMILEVFFLKFESKMLSDNLHMILQDYLDEQKEKAVLNVPVDSWTNVTAGVPLVQSLVQCSFSSTLMIYRKISIYGTHPPLYEGGMRCPKISKKGEDFL